MMYFIIVQKNYMNGKISTNISPFMGKDSDIEDLE